MRSIARSTKREFTSPEGSYLIDGLLSGKKNGVLCVQMSLSASIRSTRISMTDKTVNKKMEASVVGQIRNALMEEEGH